MPLSNLATIERTNVPTEVTHFNIQPTMEVTMSVHGRDLGHVAQDVRGPWTSSASRRRARPSSRLTPPREPYFPGSKIVVSGEYRKIRRRSRSSVPG